MGESKERQECSQGASARSSKTALLCRPWVLLGVAALLVGSIVGVTVGVVVAREKIPATEAPSAAPSSVPSGSPSASPSGAPSAAPSLRPSASPSSQPSQIPSEQPSETPSASPSSQPTANTQTTTFYAIGDVPYNVNDAVKLGIQMQNVPQDAEFVIHVGDIKNGAEECTLERFGETADLLRRSHAPVFVIPGDNEWNDCPDPDQALENWRATFVDFESRYWNHTFEVHRPAWRPECFTFFHRGTMFVGLNLVGAPVLNTTRWNARLTKQTQWVQSLIRTHRMPTVLFGHCIPSYLHSPFFNPLRNFIRDELQNSIPILYVNGDQHSWEFDQSFFNQPNWHRITLEGGASQPPVQITSTTGSSITSASDAFAFNRQL